MTNNMRYGYDVEGIVQGVGFRPFVYTLALRYNLVGFVLNNPQGVRMEVEGSLEDLTSFEEAFFQELPPLARVDSWSKIALTTKNETSFEIVHSEQHASKSSLISPDMSLCDACLKELNDPQNRRFNYFFTNCTHCGPRYSIIKTVPYDRPNTSMHPFVMCEACQAEYTNPLDRRYHAQPISCEKCGPTLSLYATDGTLIANNQEAIQALAGFIKAGHSVAMKGMGGFHLMCDATNEEVIKRLRERKKRPTKPFAVMFPSLEAIEDMCELSMEEKEGICSQIRPIVLVKRKQHSRGLSSLVAPKVDCLGVFLPYTPLHVLLLNELQIPIIATSANRSGEPIISDAVDLKEKLSDVVEYYLDYNRDIVHSSDDSVVQYVGNQALWMRTSRGIAPQSFRLSSSDSRSILAVGAHQKNSIALYLNHQVIVSPYIGDLDNVASVELFTKIIGAFEQFYNFKPDLIVADKHPNYASTQWAKAQNIPVEFVQHHYAHILSVMCEHQLREKVLGIAWDGTGYGDDGSIWGGEFFICDTNSYERILSFEPFPLLGGDASIKDIRRILASVLWQSLGDEADTILFSYFNSSELKQLKQLYNRKINSPLCSSVGRLFDAVAVLCGMQTQVSYDGESGLLIEALYDENITQCYPFSINNGKISLKDAFMLMSKEQNNRHIATKFINTLVDIITSIVNMQNLPIVLAGGVFQNRTLIKLILQKLTQKLYFPLQLPINDGGICVGQIYKVLEK